MSTYWYAWTIYGARSMPLYLPSIIMWAIILVLDPYKWLAWWRKLLLNHRRRRDTKRITGGPSNRFRRRWSSVDLRLASVADAGPTSNQHRFNALCFLDDRSVGRLWLWEVDHVDGNGQGQWLDVLHLEALWRPALSDNWKEAFIGYRNQIRQSTSSIQFLGIGNTQQIQNICITCIQCWANVEDVGPTLYKCYALLRKAKILDI